MYVNTCLYIYNGSFHITTFMHIYIYIATGKLTWLKRIEDKKDKVRTLNVFKNIHKTISDKI